MRPLKKVLINFSLATAFLAMFSLGLSDLAQAQDEFVLEEVTVTAEKREADLQKIPIAIEAVTGDTLVRTGVNELGDLDKLLPDLRIDSGGQFILPTIRNVNTFDFTPLYEMITAVFIDNVFLPTDVGYEGLFFDLERVETLKGPQGTLYGRAATAGSINLISKKNLCWVSSEVMLRWNMEIMTRCVLRAGSIYPSRIIWPCVSPTVLYTMMPTMRMAGAQIIPGDYAGLSSGSLPTAKDC